MLTARRIQDQQWFNPGGTRTCRQPLEIREDFALDELNAAHYASRRVSYWLFHG